MTLLHTVFWTAVVSCGLFFYCGKNLFSICNMQKEESWALEYITSVHLEENYPMKNRHLYLNATHKL